jgi:lambda family phage portal protein
MKNIIDRVIGWVSPSAGVARHFARRQLERAYEAASPRDTWRPRRAGASANADHLADAASLRAKSRSLTQNVSYIAAGFEGLVSSTIGTGIMPRAIGREADKINELFERWIKVCDADGRYDYYGMQAAAYEAMEVDGEVLIRLRPRRPSDNLPVPLQLQLLEIDWLDSSRTGVIDGNDVINGIEYDALGATTAYWLWPQHPGDNTRLRGKQSQSQRVPAENIIHLFSPKRPGQGRGFPRLSPVIARVRDLQLYQDAEIARKNNETRLSVMASGDATQLANPAIGDEDPQNHARDTGDLGELASGGIIQMPNGMQITVVEPKAAPGYVDYVKFELHLIAAGFGVPYEMMTGDMKEVNFSSARVRLLDFRRAIGRMQWLTIIPKALDPIHRAFVNAAYLSGAIKSRDMAVRYSPPKFDYVNPEQDVAADLAEVGGGLCSLSEKLRQRGYNPEDVFKELAADFDALKKLGILDTLLFLQKGNLPTASTAPQPKTAAS